MNWIEFEKKSKVECIDKTSKIIIKDLGNKIVDFFSFDTKIRSSRTRFIKDNLSILGDKLGYKVYANGLSPHLRQINGGTFKSSEWLFDIHWYTEGKNNYTTIRLPLVAECEWQQKRKGDKKVPFSGIKYDFQKLIVSNAELRLMIFKIIRLTDLDNLAEYFKNNIKNYKHLEPGTKFLFVAFYDRKNTFYYCEFQK